MWSRVRLALKILFKGVDVEMAVVYATLIVKGFKTFEEVPTQIKPQVAEVLRELEAGHLVTDEQY